jgi:hypothetical protein
VNVILIGNIHLEEHNGRTCGVDLRVYRWLEEWLTEDGARQLVYSLAWGRLVKLVIAYQSAISEIELFKGVLH